MNILKSYRKICLHLSFVCGALPLIMGITIFFIWFFVRDYIWALVGFRVILFGFILTFFGIILIACHSYFCIRLNDCGNKWWQKVLGSAALMFSNFPIALGLILIASLINSRIYLIIENNSKFTIHDVRIFEQHGEKKVDDIFPGEVITLYFYPKSEGALKANFSLNGKKTEIVIVGYMTSQGESDAKIVIHQNFLISVNPIN